ncbi:L-serine ammonia-lyase [Alienimonas californiensis]|uniref:L-serine ammonia-lyase n=1 Tax=Alienimonas californiensis TaxID=2527989 RepID=A0A517PCD1_9PLAN|nr:L-serine ammonia-lyase [Alienimonas californiensis]QDT17012.1 L-serine dehydratase TdcG [Alienimonas californiensis]
MSTPPTAATAFVSAFDLFKIGVGPSSSHAVGPMRAGGRFLASLDRCGLRAATTRVTVDLYGSLALTGRGHGTPQAVLAGLEGADPETVDCDRLGRLLSIVEEAGALNVPGGPPVEFDLNRDLRWHRRETLPAHPNGLRIAAFGADGGELLSREYYSIGGGFVVTAGEAEEGAEPASTAANVPFPFDSAAELLTMCESSGRSISDVVRANEEALRSPAEVDAGLDRLWAAMEACIAAGLRTPGILPGKLQVPRRAAALFEKLSAVKAPGPPDPQSAADSQSAADPLAALDWLNLWALAVNEQNAAGGRVVTAPTNGAAGIVPAVINYFRHFAPAAQRSPEERTAGTRRFLLTAAAIGSLYKKHASISGAEVGCQGEVGVACSMAAGALAEALGGFPRQVEQAAEIGMEHNLGLTCDPVGGLVQVPCIERNAMGAVKAVNAARLALCGDGSHRVSLDRVIRVMRRTGADMSSKYKETSRGGLAVNVTEC